MKKLLTVILSVLFISAMFVGCGNSKKDVSKEANSLERVKETKTFKVGLEDTYAPMEFRTNKNELVGFDIDFSKAIAKKLGAKAEFVPSEFGGLLLALNSGKFDASISAISITDERKKTVDFSEPYVMSGQIIVVKNGNNTIKKVEDLKGKKVGVQLGTTGEQAAQKAGELKELKKYDKATEPFHDLEIGRIDAVVVDEFVGRYYLSKEKGKFVIADTINQEPIGIAFKKGDKELQDAVKKAISELKEEGTLSKISIKWFGTDIYKK